MCDVENGVKVRNTEGNLWGDVGPVLGVRVSVQQLEAGHIHRVAYRRKTHMDSSLDINFIEYRANMIVDVIEIHSQYWNA